MFGSTNKAKCFMQLRSPKFFANGLSSLSEGVE